MMNIEQFFLTKVAEECAEIAQVALKAQQFGLNNVKEGQKYTNKERLSAELNDLFIILAFLEGTGSFSMEHYTEEETLAKRDKVLKYLTRSIELGLVKDNERDSTKEPPQT
jgi:NTP pyrophosphatase (non-canonical NTP hydrolase)